jgi:hypothetical protein
LLSEHALVRGADLHHRRRLLLGAPVFGSLARSQRVQRSRVQRGFSVVIDSCNMRRLSVRRSVLPHDIVQRVHFSLRRALCGRRFRLF